MNSMKGLKKRHRQILEALDALGGAATTRKIAEHVNLTVNGAAQSLGALHEHVDCLGGKEGDRKWRRKQS